MAKDTTVMEHIEDSSSFEERLNQEYQEAVSKGFNGTKEEYFEARNYT